MKLPKKLNVFGQVVKVEYAKLDENIGGLSHSSGLIQINSKLLKKAVRQVFLHEFFHSVITRLSIDQNMSIDTEEILVEGLSKCLLENFDVKVRKDH